MRQVLPDGGSALAVRIKHVPGMPVMAARVWLRGGSRVEEIPGQAHLSGRLLMEGTRRRSWDRIALETEERGMAVHSAGTGEALVVSIDALAEDAPRALAWLAELLLEPAFPEDRFDWVRRQALAELESLKDQPEVRTARTFLEQLYHPHPYCRPLQGDGDSLARLAPADCAAFHRRSLGWGGCLVVSGAFDEDAVGRRCEELFGDLLRPDLGAGEAAVAAARSALPPVAPPQGTGEPRREIRLANVEQAYLYAGHLTMPRDHPQLVALEVASVVLGAGAGVSGWLPTRIREREGLAYSVDVSTAAGAGLDPGRLVAYAGTSPATAAQAEQAMREELGRMVAAGISEADFEEARSYLIGRDPFRRETARQWADVLAEAEFYGLPVDRPEWVVERLRSLTREDVEEAARRWIRPAEIQVTLGLPED